ncbi:MAG TPA: LysR substrate-binding domain-containing protein [Allosphingosinicella sp.]|nr:LysR substrate-binding domain-containing protein [Allosphingosinicella sp.]
MPARPPSLRSITAFEAAARHQSFTKAAAELNLTTGAVSHAIRALETRLGGALFQRSGRRVSLTAGGQALASRIRLSVALLDEVFDLTPWLRRDRLVVTTLSSIAERILLPALAELKGALPETTFDIRCSSVLADFDGDVDVAIRFGPGGWHGLETSHLADERLFPVASPHYRGGALPATLDDLAGCALIHHADSNWQLWLNPVGMSARDLRSTLAIDDASLVLEAAAAGHGLALARARLVQPDLDSGRLVRLFDHDVAAEYAYWAVWNGSSPKRALIKAFVERMQEAFA